MIRLELLGLQPDGENLTLNDADGNRYLLPVTEQLRAELRRDRAAQQQDSDGETRQMGPREIQARIREGKSIDEVSDESALPASRVSALAYPILAEREYNARLARSFSLGHEVGALTVEELVASRLVARGVDPSQIRWDSIRLSGEPWTLVAKFLSGEREHRASWHIDLERRTLEALDDEAIWLSETQIPASSTPWRPANTPPADASAIAELPVNKPSVPSPYKAAEAPTAPASRIDEVLASLDSQRGKSRPMPDENNDVDTEFAGAHPALSQPEEVQDATVLSLRPRPVESTLFSTPSPTTQTPQSPGEKTPAAAEDVQLPGSTSSPQNSASGDHAVVTEDAQDSPAPKSKAKARKRNARPAMPSWDEIVFGKKD
ncbi:septation protein SepH [Actinobaculum sp. 352]|uniref:septation protein SepH n=1 Tax=Actinobaculum sp. 352 TaxID=2490946 RepID=UPI000F7E4BD8|nr:septation protein SepH [Actinobaculum sp. 352]RTE48729.1 DUF3071 domain-containing protein [Actinobaculum sp. 352]